MENNNKKQNRVSYDDILANMGLYVENGTLHKGNKQIQTKTQTQIHHSKDPLSPQYYHGPGINASHTTHPGTNIINKMSKEEYINLWLKQKIQQKQNQKIKSTKLIMPVENINVRKQQSHDVLFQFSSPQQSINLKGNPNI